MEMERRQTTEIGRVADGGTAKNNKGGADGGNRRGGGRAVGGGQREGKGRKISTITRKKSSSHSRKSDMNGYSIDLERVKIDPPFSFKNVNSVSRILTLSGHQRVAKEDQLLARAKNTTRAPP